MPKLFLEELMPEMVLEKPVTDPYGLVLFQKGTALTEKTIATLRMWGFTEVAIVGESIVTPPPSISADPVVMEEVHRTAGELFRYVNTSGIFAGELLRHTLHRLTRQRMEEHSHAA